MYTQLSSFAIIGMDVAPSFIEKNNLSVGISGVLRFYDEYLNEVRSEEIEKEMKLLCENGKCEEIIISKNNFIDFYSISLVADVYQTENANLLQSLTFTSTSLRNYISIHGFVLISMMTFWVSILFIKSVPSRLYPTRPDHWGTLYLGLLLICLDGPWLVMKYYSSYWFSTIYDIMPEIFHGIYILFLMAFFNSLTHGWANRIFGSWAIGIIICLSLIILLGLQLTITEGMPLNALSVFFQNSSMKIPVLSFTITMHSIITFIIVLGIFNIQIVSNASMILVSFIVAIPEILDIVRVILRLYASRTRLGSSFEADIAYILCTNLVCIFFITNNLPVSKGSSEGHVEKDMLTEEDPITI